MDKLLHGGDYNPEQWIDHPEMIEKDFELFKKANLNTITVGMFSWSVLEEEEGVFNFDWLDKVFDLAEANDMKVILGTPSGARPNWLADTYPDVLRTNDKREKLLFGGRHNHCFTSPNYRDKVQIINEKLAERYGNRDNLIMWHISNEFSGECHCDYCQEAFRNWLKDKYQSLENLNKAYWSTFWSHRYTDWDQIESPSPLGEMAVHALNLDWRRFVTYQTMDFYNHEVAALKKYSPDLPITTNFMADTDDLWPFQALDYSEFAKVIDVISWDSYPAWHNDWSEDYELAMKVGFINDLYRSLKDQPFLLMESTPSYVNWHDINRPKKPGFHEVAGLQYIAHGSNSVLYFQLHQSRGSSEKFHGAVVTANGSDQTRAFKEVAHLGASLYAYDSVTDSLNQSQVAVLYDWENDWVLQDIQGFSKKNMNYIDTLHSHYQYFWEHDISVDVITPATDKWDYQLVVIPMLYMMDEAMLAKVENYVANGGKVVLTYLSGMVDKTDLIHEPAFTERLNQLIGGSITELDVLYPKQQDSMNFNHNHYAIKDYAAVIETQESEVLATYSEGCYKDQAAVSVNRIGQGSVYYVGARTGGDFLADFYEEIKSGLDLAESHIINDHKDVSIQRRYSDEAVYYFVMNFSEEARDIRIIKEMKQIKTGATVNNELTLEGYGTLVLKLDRLGSEE